MKTLLPSGAAKIFLAAFDPWPTAQCMSNFRTLLNILQAPRPHKFSLVEPVPFVHRELSIAANIQLEVGHNAAYGDLMEIIPPALRPLLQLLPDLNQMAGAASPEMQHLMAIIIAFWRPGDYVLLERPQFNLPPYALSLLGDFLTKKEFTQDVIIHGPRGLWENWADYVFWPLEGRPCLRARGIPPPEEGHLEFENFPVAEVEI